jgi:SAM-dependent methyltransferase
MNRKASSGIESYAIKAGYLINASPTIYRDTFENSARYQADVYRRAGELARNLPARSVLDIGCGLATKLIEQVAPHCDEVTGVDLEETIDICQRRYRLGRWVAGNVEDPAFELERQYDLIISADVIEHLRDPDRLLDVIRTASHDATVVVLSTPERDRRRGGDDMGPPANWAHVREWNQTEFCTYLQSRGFSVRESSIVDLCEGMTTCHLVVGGFRRGQA